MNQDVNWEDVPDEVLCEVIGYEPDKEPPRCVVTSDGVHRYRTSSNGSFCNFCGEAEPPKQVPCPMCQINTIWEYESECFDCWRELEARKLIPTFDDYEVDDSY